MGEVKWQLIYKSQLEIYTSCNPGSSLVSQQQDLPRLPRRERETQAGTDLDVRESRNQPRPERERHTEPGETLSCLQAGGRRSVTGRLWPFRKGRVEPARMIGEQHRPTPREGQS